jgi:hypothetical protein
MEGASLAASGAADNLTGLGALLLYWLGPG